MIKELFPAVFWSPAREHLPARLPNAPIAQAMFPVLSPIEMTGQKGENLIATAVTEDRITDAWDLIAERLGGILGYQHLLGGFQTGSDSFQSFSVADSGKPMMTKNVANNHIK